MIHSVVSSYIWNQPPLLSNIMKTLVNQGTAKYTDSTIKFRVPIHSIKKITKLFQKFSKAKYPKSKTMKLVFFSAVQTAK